MPYMCCVLNCPNSVLNPHRKNFTFHRFPKDETLLSKWVSNINRENFVPTKHTRVCSGHFDTDSSYNIKEDKTTGTVKHRKSLRADAIPTIFDDGPPIQKKMHKLGNRKPKKKQMPMKNEDKNHSINHSVESLSNSGMNGRNQLYNHNNNTPHSQSMDGNNAYHHHHHHHSMAGLNGNGSEYEAVSTTNGLKTTSDRSSPAESDTYELTELTPMGKQDRLTPISPSVYRPSNDANSIYHRSGSIIPASQSYQQHIKEAPPPLGGNVGPLESSSMLNGTDITTYADAFKKCVISESFLYTLLRLVKCPQCGFGVNSEQMLKYESQGCLLGVRLPCYSGHLVLDWRL